MGDGRFLISSFGAIETCLFSCAAAGCDDEQAKDLVQEFSRRYLLATVREGRSRSRPLPKSSPKSLQHFLANARRHERAEIRRPPGGFVTVHELSTQGGLVFVPKDTETPEEVFQQTCQKPVLRVLNTLKPNAALRKKTTHFRPAPITNH